MGKLACVGAACIAMLAVPSAAAAQGSPPPESHFDKVVLDKTPGEPLDLAVLPDGRLLHARQGHVWLHDPPSGLKTLAAQCSSTSTASSSPARPPEPTPPR